MNKKNNPKKPKTQRTQSAAKPKRRFRFSPVLVFLLTVIVSELFLVLCMPHIVSGHTTISHSFFLNGGRQQAATGIASFNPAVQTLWTAEIVGLLAAGIYSIVQRRNYTLGAVYSPNVAAVLGLYGLYFGFYYPSSYPATFNPLTQTAFPYLVVANLWLVGGLVAGWLLGKGLECAGKRAFWI